MLGCLVREVCHSLIHRRIFPHQIDGKTRDSLSNSLELVVLNMEEDFPLIHLNKKSKNLSGKLSGTHPTEPKTTQTELAAVVSCLWV